MPDPVRCDGPNPAGASQGPCGDPERPKTPRAGVPAAYGALSASPGAGSVNTDSPDGKTAPAGPVHRRWETLSDEQLELARWLTDRDQELWTAADGELSLAEAVTLAAVQARHRIPTGGDPR